MGHRRRAGGGPRLGRRRHVREAELICEGRGGRFGALLAGPLTVCPMPSSGLLAFVCPNVPLPPCRLLEVGAGNGELARAIAEAGYEVVAIDPEPSGEGVRAVPLLDLDEPAASFDAALAVTSLPHVDPP